MSTSKAVPVASTGPAALDDVGDTGLIAQLMREILNGNVPEVGQVPSSLPTPVPSLPAGSASTTNAAPVRLPVPTVFGSPSLTPGLPQLPTGGSDDTGLAGGYPTASSPTHPPVHPLLSAATPAPVHHNAPAATPTGAHDPAGQEAYAFGEPRCNGSVFKNTNGHSEKRRVHPPAQGHPLRDGSNPVPNVPDESLSDGAQYYFLSSPEPSLRQAPARLPGTSLGPVGGLDIEAIRRDFPALHQRVNGRPLVWLDNAATTHKPRQVIEATSEFYRRDNSNIHRAAHTLAARSTELFENGREKARQFLGAADAKEIIFVRGTTEAINLVAQSYGRQNIGAGDEILLTRLEHHANIVPWQLLAQQTGAVIRVAPLNENGEVILEEWVRLLGPKTRFVSVAHVSNALGTVNNVEEMIALAHTRGVPVLVDGAQSTPHLPINVQALNADFYAFSGHKVFGPTGIGCLYGKKALLEAMPPWQGGGHMIRDVTFEKTAYQNAPEKFEAGTPDIAGVVGLAAALEYLLNLGLPAVAAYEHQLLEYATEALSSVPGIRLVGTALHKASVLSFVIPGRTPESIARHLDQHGIAVRAGHHCAQPALRHFGLEATVRPSLALYNHHQDVDALVEALYRL